MKGKLFAVLVIGLGLIAPSMAGAQGAAAPTFSKDVAPIFYKNCTVCHTAVHGSNRSPQLLK